MKGFKAHNMLREDVQPTFKKGIKLPKSMHLKSKLKMSWTSMENMGS